MNNPSLVRTTALAGRIFRQFTRDRRTSFLLFLAPVVIMSLVYYLLEGPQSRIPFAIALENAESSVVFDIVKRSLEEDQTVALAIIAPTEVENGLKTGRFEGALVVNGGSLDDLMSGKGAKLSLHLEGSDAVTTRELVIILSGLRKRLISAVRDVISVAGDDSASSMASMDMTIEYMYGGADFTPTDYLAPIIISVFAFVLTFLLTSVSFLRERSSGTMERLLVSPISRSEIIVGYLLGFLLFTLIQACIILGFEIYVLKVHYVGSLWLIFAIVILVTIVAGNLGIFLSGFAKTELQVAQFMPLVIFPLILVSGVFWSIESMPKWLKPLAYLSPLTWANEALRNVMIKGFGASGIMPQALALCGFALLFLVLGSLTMRKQPL